MAESNLRRLAEIGLAMYYVVMAAVGMLIPMDILAANAWARDFSDFMASMVPQIERITDLDIKPDANRFYFSVLWAGAPVLLFIALLMTWDGWRTGYAPMWRTPFTKAIGPILFVALMVASMLQFSWLVDPSIKLSRFLFGTALGRAFIAQLFVLIPIFFLPAVGVWVIGWVTGYIPRKIGEKRNG